MLRIALCDDEQEARDQLRFQLEKSIYETDEEIVYEFSSGETAVRWLKKHPGEIDLLFLDVEMKEMTGMEAAERIREFDKTILLVFVTGYSEYVFDGYRTGALDYVMKPAGEERIRQIVSRAREAFYSRREKDFVFQNQEGTFRIALDQILYFYSDRRQVYLVTENREYAFYGKLSEVQFQVDADSAGSSGRPERGISQGASGTDRGFPHSEILWRYHCEYYSQRQGCSDGTESY